MATRQKRSNPLAVIAVPAVCAILLTYFLFHAWSGRYGIEAMRVMEDEQIALQFELARLRQERQAMEARVSLLRDGTIERDMLDEQTRYTLEMIGEHEMIILSR